MSVRLWSSVAWREQAVGWIDRRLAEAGLERTGEVEQPRVRPWATVLRAPTTGGDVWMKAAGPATAFEAGLYELLAREAPDDVLAPAGRRRAARLDAAARRRAVARRAPRRRRLGGGAGNGARAVRPAAALARPARRRAAGARRAGHAAGGDARGASRRRSRRRGPARRRRRPGRRPVRGEPGRDAGGASRRCATTSRAGASGSPPRPCPASLDHNDLHQDNVLGDGPVPLLRLGRRRGRPRVRGDARARAGARRPAARPRPRRLPGGLRRPRPAGRARRRPRARLPRRPDRPHADLGARAALGTRPGRAARPVLRPRPLRGTHDRRLAQREACVDPVDAEAGSASARREEVAGGRADRAGGADAGLERGGGDRRELVLEGQVEVARSG